MDAVTAEPSGAAVPARDAFDSRGAEITFLALVAAAIGLAAYALSGDSWNKAIVLGGVAGFGLLLALVPARIPATFKLLFLGAALASAGFYTWRFWREATPFDESVHFMTSWALACGLTWILFGADRIVRRPDRAFLVAAAIAIGTSLGIVWEGIELALGIQTGVQDTVVDLLADLLGSVAAGTFLAWASGKVGPQGAARSA
ncbi:hypothetical protein H8M03_10095 [Sphingomonas sabuli]|uniref:DUF2238 domain-containing protein n=1 Tax=Sphingomonas sabuli TaxID=2764186 RepID=A0A7G9L159_9SPHN|nr:hypothetical protein [Sphingomonas sabuli]QNM82358.1 hypothetical protein H8M03_10095 [Sphingomonas sabuli]